MGGVRAEGVDDEDDEGKDKKLGVADEDTELVWQQAEMGLDSVVWCGLPCGS